MTLWVEAVERIRPPGLPAANHIQVTPGQYLFAFVHGEDSIIDPSHDPGGSAFVSPREYGFSIRGFQGGNTAWARDFSNGTMLLTSPDGQSHVLSPRFAARIVFLATDGTIMQDTGADRRNASSESEVVTVRMTISATLELNGSSSAAARAQLVEAVHEALDQWSQTPQSRIALLDHAVDQVTVSPDRRNRSSDTDFSQLLDM